MRLSISPSLSAFVVATGVSLGMVGPSSAEQIITLFSNRSKLETTTTQYVDTHDIIVLDISESMDDADISAAFQGAADYYLSDRNLANYQMGICAQSTIVFFGKEAFVGNSAIICSKEEAQAFSDDLLNENIPVLREIVGSSSTNTGSGLLAAHYTFQQNMERNAPVPLQYRVVVVGDELQKIAEQQVKKVSGALVQDFDAQIFGIAIGNEKARDGFTHFMASDKDHFPSALANNPETVRDELNNFLRHTMG